jgi:hypothetical protein
MKIDKRFMFSGHAIGVSAHFHRLDDVHNLNHFIPTLGSSVLSPVGGRSHHEVKNFFYTADEPRRRILLSAQHVEATAHGSETDDQFETETRVFVRGVSVLEKLHVGVVELEQSATRAIDSPTSLIRTKVAKIEDLRLGNVTVHVQLDREPFENCCTKQELLDFYGKQDDSYRRENGWRFSSAPQPTAVEEINGRVFATLVKKIDLEGPADELRTMKVDGHTIYWEGFGKIYLGEVMMRDEDRHVNMIRLKMGSDGGGSGLIGGGQTNGGTVP